MSSLYEPKLMTRDLESVKRIITRRFKKHFRKTALASDLPSSLHKLTTKIFCSRELSLKNLSIGSGDSSFCHNTQTVDISQGVTEKAALFKDYLVAILQENVSYSFAQGGLRVCQQIISDVSAHDFSVVPGAFYGDYRSTNVTVNDDKKCLSWTRIFYIYFAACVIQHQLHDIDRCRELLQTIQYESDNIFLERNCFYESSIRKVCKIAFEINTKNLMTYDEFCSWMSYLEATCTMNHFELARLTESLSKDETFDSIESSNTAQFRAYTSLLTPVHMRVDWSWNAFKKWNMAYLFSHAGHEFVDTNLPSDPPHRGQLFELICTLENPTDRLHLSEAEAFKDIRYLYMDCLPRPFPNLKSLWHDSKEAVVLLVKNEIIGNRNSIHNHLLVQIFGFTIVEVEYIFFVSDFESEIFSKVCILAPKEAVFLPAGCNFRIESKTSCCYKRYTWGMEDDNAQLSGKMPQWITLSDELNSKRKEKYRHGKTKIQSPGKDSQKANSRSIFPTPDHQFNGESKDIDRIQPDKESLFHAAEDPRIGKFPHSPRTDSGKSKSQETGKYQPMDQDVQCSFSIKLENIPPPARTLKSMEEPMQQSQDFVEIPKNPIKPQMVSCVSKKRTLSSDLSSCKKIRT